MSSPSLSPRMIPPNGSKTGRSLNVVGDTLNVLLDGSDTAGAFALFDVMTPPGGGPPLHLHHREDEFFFILEGEAEFMVAGQRNRAGAGTFVAAPREIPHAFHNPGSTPLHMLIMVRPAGAEKFFEEASVMTPPGSPPDIEKFSALAQRYGMEILGPPLSAM
jgi:mannose-6-phosphate isomerase-like protein (cupin superfamily)